MQKHWVNTKHQQTVHVLCGEIQRGALSSWSCQLCPAAENDEEEVDEGCSHIMQSRADLLCCGSDWRSAMSSTGDPEASHVTQKGEGFSLGCFWFFKVGYVL